MANVEDLQVVDCLLPGQIRRLGASATYVTRGRPIRTAARDCRIRGGEYVAYDRADYATALKVWLEPAKAGNAEAQAYVGEIYEKGLGTAPDFAAAAKWYRLAADQDYAPAQISLGMMYERGAGVPKDVNEALRWYRRASGLSKDQIRLASTGGETASPEDERLKRELTASQEKLAQLKRTLNRLQEEAATQQAAAAAGASTSPRQNFDAERQDFRIEIASLRSEIEAKNAQIAGPRTQSLRSDSAGGSGGAASSTPTAEIPRQRFGSYYALVIGNNDYQHLKKLETAVADAQSVSDILAKKYGFKVTTLINVKKDQILDAFYKINKETGEGDNLLVYYAGHGQLEDVPERGFRKGYWIPVDGEPDNPAKWVSNTDVTDFIWTANARHVLVVANSCYSGALLRSIQTRLRAGSTEKAKTAWIEALLGRASRTVLSSGGLAPVLDTSGGGHSVFAQALLDILRENTGILDGGSLGQQVASRVTYAAAAVGVTQTPEYAPIEFAHHAGGEFFLVPAQAIAQNIPAPWSLASNAGIRRQ